MATRTLSEQLTKYLTDAHCIEKQAAIQMMAAPRLAGDPQMGGIFSDHLAETRGHAQLVGERLQARGAAPARAKDVAGWVSGAGFAAFAALQPDTPGKLVVHAFSYEHMEEAAYDLLGQVADREGDTATAEVARRIAEQERAMGERVAGCFDRAAQAALRGGDPDTAARQVTKYLTDAHAVEGQALQLLSKGPKLAGAPELASAYSEHRQETEEHERLVANRLQARGATPNRFKDVALRVGALNWGAFFAVQPDTPAKLAAFAYAFEHLEIAGYEMLKRVATAAGDQESVQIAEQILVQERAAADRLRQLLPTALDAALRHQGIAAAA